MHPDSKSRALRSPLGCCLNEASFWRPDFIDDTSAWLEHAPFAFWLMSVLRPRSLVELGTHGGYSYFAFCQAVKSLGLETRCTAVDTWKGDEHAGFYGNEVFERAHSHNAAHFADFSELIPSTFDEALDRFPDGSIDILHIDGRHFYNDVRHDFEHWRRKLSDRAVVLFHDTQERERGFGVHKLWAELSPAFPTFEFLHGSGLGILGYGSNLPDDVADLFASKDAGALRSAYARLGASIAAESMARKTLAQLNAKLLALDAERDDLAGKLAAQEGAIQAMIGSTSWKITAPLRRFDRNRRA